MVISNHQNYLEHMADLQQVNNSLKRKFKDKKLIFGSGDATAKICFICEMPGEDEEREGKPLTGLKEKLLNQLLKNLGVNKKKVYITNVVKYVPRGKIPTPKEVKSYVPFLKEELKTINPQLVVTLGNMALNGIGLRQPLDNVHGRIFNLGSYELFPTFHPEHALKDPQIKTLLELDFVRLKNLIETKKN